VVENRRLTLVVIASAAEGSDVAIMPHCVVCGFDSGAEVAGSVEFADYSPDWRPPTNADGYQVLGWSNAMGVTAPDGVGLFCQQHLARAKRLRHLTSGAAVDRLSADVGPVRGLLARLRDLFR
jgi:hypothetical protein